MIAHGAKASDRLERILHQREVVADIDAHADLLAADPSQQLKPFPSPLVLVVLDRQAEPVPGEDRCGPLERFAAAFRMRRNSSTGWKRS